MLHMRDDVLIDWTGAVLCPFHGAQPGAEYAAGCAPCGCQWVARGKHGALRAVRGAKVVQHFATDIAPLGDLAHTSPRDSVALAC